MASKPFLQIGNQPQVVNKKPRPKKSDPVPVGTAWTWYCPYCEGFTITFFEEVTFGEAKCSVCTAKVKLDLVNVGTNTPSAPKKKAWMEKDTAVFEM